MVSSIPPFTFYPLTALDCRVDSSITSRCNRQTIIQPDLILNRPVPNWWYLFGIWMLVMSCFLKPRSVPEKYKPVIFKHGQPVPFPEPNRKVKAPTMWAVGDPMTENLTPPERCSFDFTTRDLVWPIPVLHGDWGQARNYVTIMIVTRYVKIC